MSLKISEAHQCPGLTISFELFPPKDEAAEAKLFDEAVPQMVQLQPAFMTCTYGAGGSTQAKTLDIVTRVRRETGLAVASHLTCVGASRKEIGDFLERAGQADVCNIVALRGDPPRSDSSFRPHPDGFEYAVELVRFIHEQGGFDIAVAGYPEGHPESDDKYLDWQRCRDKVEAGGGVIITQLFYDNRDFFEFDDYLRNKLGVKVPIVPGILPILSGQQIRKFCDLCGAKLPDEVAKKLDSFGDDHVASRAYGVELATRMCQELIDYGVPGFHFYTLNRVWSTREVIQNLGIVPRGQD